MRVIIFAKSSDFTRKAQNHFSDGRHSRLSHFYIIPSNAIIIILRFLRAECPKLFLKIVS